MLGDFSKVAETLGYHVTDKILNGNEYGALEKRERLAMVAVCKSMGEFDIESVKPIQHKPETLAAVLDEDGQVADKWRVKEKRDMAAGKGFRRQLVNPDSGSVPTITREYQKVRSTDPQLAHPTNPLLSRLFTPGEHARIKGIPSRIIDGLASTVAHEVMGQSVIFPAFRAVGRAIGAWLQTFNVKGGVFAA